MELLLRVIQVCVFVGVVVVLCLFNLAETTPLLLHFDEAPLPISRFTTALFRYSVVSSHPCTNNGCSIYCELDGHTLTPCPLDHIILLKNLTPNTLHHFHLNVTANDGQANFSTYSWFIDTIPPTATIFSKQSYTGAEKVAVDIEFSESCAGNGGFKCSNSSNCDVIVSGPAYVDASSLSIIKAGIKYSLNIILSPRSTYARVVIKMENNFCTDLAGNHFTRTNGSIFILHLDRRPVEVDLWTAVPSYELEINGVPRTITATNKLDDLKLFLDFSSPVINSTLQILNALHLNSSGVVLPIHSRDHGNRKFAFQLKNIARTEIIRLELQAASVLGRTGTPVSSVAPLTFLYDCAEPGVWLSTSSPRVTKESSINVIIEFTKPVFGFEASKVEAVGGSLTRFKQLSRALYSMTVLADSQSISVAVPAGKAYDISGNLNLASNQLQVEHYSAPAISVALYSFMSAGILATSLAAALLSLSSANLQAIGTRTTTTTFSDPSMNLHGMLGHLQVFVLSDWLSDRLPVEYSETTRGLRWLIPREKLPWKRESSSIWPPKNYFLPTEAKTAFDQQGLPYQIYPRGGSPREQQNVTIKDTPYGLTLDSSEYFTYFLRGEPLSASNVVKRLESYKGWQDLVMNMFWLGVGGGFLFTVHILILLFVRWRTQTSAHGILSVPRFELFLLILMLPCISQSSAFVIRGGTTRGILTGALLLTIPAGLILSVCLFLVIAIFSGKFAQYKEIKHVGTRQYETWYTKLWHLFTGWPTTGKWFYREGLPSSFLPRFGILFENRKGPPLYVFVNQNDPTTTISKWTESGGQNGIGGRMRASSDDSNEETKVPLSKRLLGCGRSSYVILDLIRRVSLGILSGFHSSSSRVSIQSLFAIFALTISGVQLLCLLTLRPYISRGVHAAESLCLLCEAVIFGLSIARNRSIIPIKESHLGYLMLSFLCIAFVSQIINEWYAMIKCILRFSHPQKKSFKYGMKLVTKGLLLPLLPRKHWSGIVSYQPKTGPAPLSPAGPAEYERRRVTSIDPLSAMTATVVPVHLSPGSPAAIPAVTASANEPANLGGAKKKKTAEGGKRVEGLKLDPKNEMKRLRQLARASLSGGSKCEEGSTS